MARGMMLLAEFDYTLLPAPSIPFIDTTKERSDMWLLKRYGLELLHLGLTHAPAGTIRPPGSAHCGWPRTGNCGAGCHPLLPRSRTGPWDY